MKKILVIVASAMAVGAQAVVVGQTDTFTSDIQNWGGGASPTWISTGGPAGAGDGFLQVTGHGGGGPGSKVAVLNSNQWSGNYSLLGAAPVISVDMKNLGSTALIMRLILMTGGTSTQWVSQSSANLAVGSAWQHFTFTLSSSQFNEVETGSPATSFADTLANMSQIMFRHHPDATATDGVAIVGSVGIDNVHVTPEPASFLALGLGVLAVMRRRKRS